MALTDYRSSDEAYNAGLDAQYEADLRRAYADDPAAFAVDTRVRVPIGDGTVNLLLPKGCA